MVRSGGSPSMPKSRPIAVSLYSSAVELKPVRFASFLTSVIANFCLNLRILGEAGEGRAWGHGGGNSVGRPVGRSVGRYGRCDPKS